MAREMICVILVHAFSCVYVYLGSFPLNFLPSFVLSPEVFFFGMTTFTIVLLCKGSRNQIFIIAEEKRRSTE